MRFVSRYNPVRDIQDVQDGLAQSLSDAIMSGMLENGLNDSDFDGVDDPSNIGFRVRDPFDAIDKMRSRMQSESLKTAQNDQSKTE